MLAPMAGITNTAYRRLCREYGAGLYVSEMVTSRALIERSPETIRMVTPDPDEQIRSVQLYGVDPEVMSKAVEMLIREDRADHIDLNMGCPVPKVTKKGGGAALPWKQDLFKDILESAVNTSNKITFFEGLLFGYGYFLAGIYWIAISLLVDVEKFAWLIPFALTIIPGFLALYFGFLAIIFSLALREKQRYEKRKG